MENENKVIMSLEEYTKLIIENNDLKNLLRRCERRVKDCMNDDAIKNYEIENMAKEKCEEWLRTTNDRYMLGQLSYSHQIKNLNEMYPMFSIKEIEGWALERIKSLLENHLEELKEQEQ